MSKKPVFTTITLTFNRPEMLKETVASIFAQTYPHLEVIIINNAATSETQEYLSWLERQDNRVKLVHFKTNQYDPNDPIKFADICYNAALKVAEGDYVFYLSDDDLISPDFAQRMVDLFEGDPECTTAAGLTISVDANKEVIPVGPRTSNFRPRYMPGYYLALDTLNEGSTIFAAPGNIFTIKREVLVKAGGFHRVFESSQLYGILPFGVTGFDEKAILYWRRYAGQLSQMCQSTGFVTADYHRALLKEWDLHKKWEERFGKRQADYFVRKLIGQKTKTCADHFVCGLYTFSWRSAWHLFSKLWWRWDFWRFIPEVAWKNKFLLKQSLKNIFRKRSCQES